MLVVADHFDDLGFLQRRHATADHRLAGNGKLQESLPAAGQQRKL